METGYPRTSMCGIRVLVQPLARGYKRIIMQLIECSRTNPLYKQIRDRHYVENKGCIGRQIHYLIYEGNGILEQPVGIISGASAVWACKPRDDFFDINRDNRIKKIGLIINNVVFRLEKNEKNLATKILSIWRKQIIKDWNIKYGETAIGFETFVFGENRTGALYKADNWVYVGETKGSAKYKPHGAYSKGERKKVPIKLIYCKYVKKQNF